jgi:hypothetical protein
MESIPTPDLHTPDELLANASAMYQSGNPKLFRGAILESITALEAFVQKTVFSSLRGKIDPLLVTLLEEKTRMDFDSRLSVLTPVATGLPINKSHKLWNDYKKAKEIRNKVVHSGRKVTENDVSSVMETVRDWLSYLSSTVEFETVLLDFKRWVEQNTALSIQNEAQATQLVIQFFQQINAASAALEVEITIEGARRRADVVLDFGPRKVLVETRFLRDSRNIGNVIDTAVGLVDQMRKAANIQQACVIAFVKRTATAIPDGVRRHHDGEIISVAIHVGMLKMHVENA